MRATKSDHLFVNIGGIEDMVLEALLHDVVIGHGTLQRLNEQCAMVKARMKVQAAVLQHVDVNESDWDVRCGKFTLAFNDAFVERWASSLVREGVKARAALPPGFHEELDRRVALDVGSVGQRVGSGLIHLSININELVLSHVHHNL